MITGVHHIGIIVSDREKAIEFYGDILGGELLYTSEAGPGDIAKQIGVEGASNKAAVIKVGNSILELVEYVNPKCEPKQMSPCDIGTLHLAFEVDDINETVERLQKKGIKFTAVPKYIDKGKMKGWVWVYFKDPDGCQLELVENRGLKDPL